MTKTANLFVQKGTPLFTAAQLRTPRQLIWKALDRIEANPAEWNQASWNCDTPCCLIGHVDKLLVEGLPENHQRLIHQYKKNWQLLYMDVQTALRITDEEWCELSCATNTLDDLKRITTRIFGAHP